MPPSAAKRPRSYLPAPQRREQLLDVASGLVRRGGWSALSMQGLALAAGVSRQLVYERFATAEDLYLATLTHLFERAHAATEAIVRSGTSVADTVGTSFALFLDLPPEERHALRALAAETGPSRSITRARTRLRSRIAAIWAPYVRQQTGLNDAEATALAWMLTTAAWGLSDAIADRTLARSHAIDLFTRFATTTLSAWRVRGSSTTTTTARQSRRRPSRRGGTPP